MQNFELLKELGQLRKPILLKRGLASTIQEWLMSAEYVMAGGNENVILILFSRDDTYLFRQNEMFFLDTRIHYSGAITNPYTPIVQLRMNRTLFAQGEEVGVNV